MEPFCVALNVKGFVRSSTVGALSLTLFHPVGIPLALPKVQFASAFVWNVPVDATLESQSDAYELMALELYEEGILQCTSFKLLQPENMLE